MRKNGRGQKKKREDENTDFEETSENQKGGRATYEDIMGEEETENVEISDNLEDD